MITLVLQHLENLHLELMAIDPTHRTDAADKVAALASDLRRAVVDATYVERQAPFDRQSAAIHVAA